MKKYFFVAALLFACTGMSTSAAPVAQRDNYECRDNCGHHGRAMSSSDFNYLYSAVKKDSFTDDKIKDIRLGALGSKFTCEQVASILRLFDFSDDKLKALGCFSGKIVDLKNSSAIIDSFTFDSEKKMAYELLLQ